MRGVRRFLRDELPTSLKHGTIRALFLIVGLMFLSPLIVVLISSMGD